MPEPVEESSIARCPVCRRVVLNPGQAVCSPRCRAARWRQRQAAVTAGREADLRTALERMAGGLAGAIQRLQEQGDRRDMPSDRERDAQRHLDKALAAARAGFIGTAVRYMDGYTVTCSKRSRVIARSGIDEAVLEDDPSPRLEALVEEIRGEMDRGE